MLIRILSSFVKIAIILVIFGIATAETYTYDNAGRLTGVTYDDGSTVSYTSDTRGNRLQLTRNIPGPDIMLAQTTLGFGNIDVGGSSTSLTVSISNNGTTDLAVSNIGLTGANAAEFGVVPGTCASLSPTIGAASNCTVMVSFSPSSIGVKSAALNIVSNDADTPSLNVALSGQGASPNISVIPTPLGFGPIDIGSVSSSQIITISNSGSADLVVSIGLSGVDVTQFNVTTGTCASLSPTISPASNCSISITFAPTLVGAKSAALNIASNDPDTPNISVALSGTGQAVGGGGGANIAVTPVSHDFGSVDVGSTSTPQTITINNTGTADLVVSSIALTGTDAAEFDVATGTCSSLSPTIAAASDCTIEVTLSPTSTGVKSAALSIASNDGDTPNLSVTISGSGQAVPPANNPPSIPVLLSPAANAVDLDPTSIIFKWQAGEDQDGDTLSYQFTICEDPTFNGCGSVTVASTVMGISVALLGSSGSFLLLGLIGNQTRRKRHWWLSPKLALLVAIILMSSCGGGGGSSDDPPPADTNISHTVNGLKPATTYHWKVSASDGIDTVESATRSFTTL